MADGALAFLCGLLGPFTRFVGRSLASSPAALAVHTLESGLALTNGNRMPANPTLSRHRWHQAPLQQDAVMVSSTWRPMGARLGMLIVCD